MVWFDLYYYLYLYLYLYVCLFIFIPHTLICWFKILKCTSWCSSPSASLFCSFSFSLTLFFYFSSSLPSLLFLLSYSLLLLLSLPYSYSFILVTPLPLPLPLFFPFQIANMAGGSYLYNDIRNQSKHVRKVQAVYDKYLIRKSKPILKWNLKKSWKTHKSAI